MGLPPSIALLGTGPALSAKAACLPRPLERTPPALVFVVALVIAPPPSLGSDYEDGDEDDWALSHRAFDELHQVGVGFDRLELRELLLHVLRRAEEEADVGLAEHGGVIERIAP
jgi:hypothetical protein